MIKKEGIFKDKNDGSIKCVFSENKKIIEMTLLFNRSDTDVVCVPTHHFCNLGCKMCHLTNNSLNKSSEKIKYEDFIYSLINTICNQRTHERRTNKRKLLLSFMGVGEPTLNFELIVKINEHIEELKELYAYDEIGFAIATMMPNNTFRDLINIVNENDIPLKIHFSMHSPFDKERKNLIPSSINSIKWCLDSLEEYRKVISQNGNIMKNYIRCHSTNDLVEIHYTLIKGINDSDADLNEICNLLKKYNFTIKFIRFNPKEDMYISEREQYWVETIKERTNVRVKTYSPPGKGVGASCGEFTKHYYHEEIETEKQKQEFLEWKQEYQIFD